MCNGVPTKLFAEIFFREAYFKSLTEVSPVPILWKDVLNFVQRHIEPDGITKDKFGHTPAGSIADSIVQVGLGYKWISRKARGQYSINSNIKSILLCTPEQKDVK